MKPRVPDKISSVSRQNLADHLLVTFVAPDLDVNVEPVCAYHDLPRRRVASAQTGYAWLDEAIENNFSRNITISRTYFVRPIKRYRLSYTVLRSTRYFRLRKHV